LEKIFGGVIAVISFRPGGRMQQSVVPRSLRTKVSGYATAVDSRLLLCVENADVTAISIS
jgi:hypothetical protein